MRAYTKDILRTLRGEKKRLLALMTISALGVTMMTGLKASCDDLRSSADELFDAQRLHDITVVSTLGLRDADIEALGALESVETVQGCFSKTVQTELGGGYTEALICTFEKGGIDEPYILEGRLPESVTEAAVTGAYIKVSGKSLGDRIKIIEEIEEAEDSEDIEGFEELNEEPKIELPNTEYTITGIVTDVTAVVNPDGATSFRSTGTEDYTIFVIPAAVDADYYTSVDLTVKNARELDAFSGEYERLIQGTKQEIEGLVKENRQREGYREIRAEAEGKIDTAEKKVKDALNDAQTELDVAEKQLHDGKVEADYGEVKLVEGIAEAKGRIASGRAQIAEGRVQLEAGFGQLDAAKAQLEAQEQYTLENEQLLLSSKAELEAGKVQLEAGKAELGQREQSKIADFDAKIAQSNEEISRLQDDIATLDPEAEDYAQRLESLSAELLTAQSKLAKYQSEKQTAQQGFEAERQGLNTEEAVLNGNLTRVNADLEALEAGKAQIPVRKAQLAEKYALAELNKTALDTAEQEINIGEKQAEEELLRSIKEFEDGKRELEDGIREFEDGVIELNDKKAEAREKLADARAELEDIPECVWYVRDRGALNGFADIKSDAQCIESIGTVFPVMFLLVAVLISLTAINRMVDENRGLIGTYQALGFRGAEIRRKFAVYSSAASIAGGILGNLLGFIALPEIIIIIFRQMYLIPEYTLGYDAKSGIGGILLFYAAIVGTTLISCGMTVKKMPAVLMRPKAPQAGSRILLERIKPVWTRMSFLNKVTARNLFRYKKRFLMTVFGIAGCTGLLLCGFSIKDTVADLLPKQYEQIISYDIMAVTAGDEDFEKLRDYIDREGSTVGCSTELTVTNVDIHNDAGDTITVQLFVLPEGTDTTPYFTLKTLAGEQVTLPSEGCLITENIQVFMGYEKGDTMRIQDMALTEAQVRADNIVEFYLGNCIFMTEREYERLFDEYSPNALLICVQDTQDEAMLTAALNARDEVISVSSVGELKDGFKQSFLLMNMVVYVVIVLAGALAFAVLFTLAATNISERDRELATIKVLGFFDGEVHTYVNKETVILTLIGILAGLPLGVYLGDLLGSALKMPAIVFKTVVHPISYALSAGITIAFAIIVNTMTNRIIDKINPIEALKCVE